jgi:hypothetical protein
LNRDEEARSTRSARADSRIRDCLRQNIGQRDEAERGQWAFHGKPPEVEQLAGNVSYFDPRQHAPDRLAALVLAAAAEQRSNRVEVVPPRPRAALRRRSLNTLVNANLR